MKATYEQVKLRLGRIARNSVQAINDMEWLSENGAEAIRLYRESLGMTQQELAEKLGVTNTYISHVEGGRMKLSRSMAAMIGEKI